MRDIGPIVSVQEHYCNLERASVCWLSTSSTDAKAVPHHDLGQYFDDHILNILISFEISGKLPSFGPHSHNLKSLLSLMKMIW